MTWEVAVVVLRTSRLLPLGCTGVLGLLVVVVPIGLGAHLDFLDATLTLHLAMITLLVGAAFVLDDPARSLTEALPISARTTAAIRMGITLLPVSIFWALILWLAPYVVVAKGAFPRAGLIVEAYAVLVWVWAVAAFAARRRTGGDGSSVAAPALLVLSVVLAMLPDSVACFVPPGAPEYASSRVRWLALLVTGSVALAAAARGIRLRR